MITRDDIEAFMGDEYDKQEHIGPVTPNEYGLWVEDMVVTKGPVRMIENSLGLVGEAGEFAEKIKKVYRDNVMDNAAILNELGDVLFYVTALANYFGSSLQQVMEMNIAKLNDRKQRGVISGSGDTR